MDGSGESEARSLGIAEVYRLQVNEDALAIQNSIISHGEEPNLNSVGGKIHGINTTGEFRSDTIWSGFLNDATRVAGDIEVNTVAVGLCLCSCVGERGGVGKCTARGSRLSMKRLSRVTTIDAPGTSVQSVLILGHQVDGLNLCRKSANGGNTRYSRLTMSISPPWSVRVEESSVQNAGHTLQPKGMCAIDATRSVLISMGSFETI